VHGWVEHKKIFDDVRENPFSEAWHDKTVGHSSTEPDGKLAGSAESHVQKEAWMSQMATRESLGENKICVDQRQNRSDIRAEVTVAQLNAARDLEEPTQQPLVLLPFFPWSNDSEDELILEEPVLIGRN